MDIVTLVWQAYSGDINLGGPRSTFAKDLGGRWQAGSLASEGVVFVVRVPVSVQLSLLGDIGS